MVAEMSNPHEPGRISVTLKQDGKDGTWIVFHGSAAEIRRQIIDVFSMEGEQDAPLYDLINEATRIYKSTGNISSALGGRVIGKKDGAPSGGGSGSAWEQAASTPQEEAVDINVVRLTKAIEAADNVQALKELYARNKVHFDGNAELFAEWQAKGKALSSS